MQMSIKVKDETMKEFNKTIDEYAAWNKRQPAEIVNAKLYFIALQAMRKTKIADKETIKNELMEPSSKFPSKTLGEILTLNALRAKGKVLKTGNQFASAVTKFIKRRINHVGFLRSGWLPCVKKLDYWNKRGDIQFTKRFAPKKPEGIKQYGKEKGDVIPARLDQTRVRGTIFNFVGQGKQDSATVKPILQAGLDSGVREEIKSMKLYIERKFNEYHAKLVSKNRYK